jgi:hypothetical protein
MSEWMEERTSAEGTLSGSADPSFSTKPQMANTLCQGKMDGKERNKKCCREGVRRPHHHLLFALAVHQIDDECVPWLVPHLHSLSPFFWMFSQRISSWNVVKEKGGNKTRLDGWMFAHEMLHGMSFSKC